MTMEQHTIKHTRESKEGHRRCTLYFVLTSEWAADAYCYFYAGKNAVDRIRFIHFRRQTLPKQSIEMC